MKALWILLGILRGIGVLLLVLLFLLLLLVLLVLLSPICYRLEGEKKAEISGSFGVSWLLGALRAEGSLGGAEGTRCRVQVLWFPIIGGEAKQKKRRKRAKKRRKAEKELRPMPAAPDLTAAEKTDMPPAPQEPQPIPARMQEKERRRVAPAPKAETSAPLPQEPQPKTMRRVPLTEIEEKPPEEAFAAEDLDEDFFTGEEIPEAAEKSEKMPPILKKLWKIEDKRGIFRAFGKLLGRILRGILPGHFRLSGTFGLGEPAWTGYLLGLVGILQAKFGNAIQVKGDFARLTAADITIKLDGKIRLGSLLWAMLAFVLAKPVRGAVKFIWKERKAQKGKGEQNG